MITVKSLRAAQALPYINELARLRITVFRAFPYLYDGDEAYEARYLRTYIDSPDSVVVLVFDDERIVGASTGLPLAHETENVLAPLRAAALPIENIFYFGESVLLAEFRGQGLGRRFFEARETHARKLGFDYTCFCAVDRAADHPRRPADYVPLDRFWEKRGYQKQPQLKASFIWRDLDEAQASSKAMTFWLKTLANTETNT